jgi:hypothetical protein
VRPSLAWRHGPRLKRVAAHLAMIRWADCEHAKGSKLVTSRGLIAATDYERTSSKEVPVLQP